MASTDGEKEKASLKFHRTGRGRRQDHGSRGNTGGKGIDDREWKISSTERRDSRHGAEEVLIVEVLEEE